MHVIVRGALSRASLAPGFPQSVASLDPRPPLRDVRPLGDLVAAATARTRLTVRLLGVAAGAALLLGTIERYAVIAYAFAGRAAAFAARRARRAIPPRARHGQPAVDGGRRPETGHPARPCTTGDTRRGLVARIRVSVALRCGLE
jgi:hypothetical protein